MLLWSCHSLSQPLLCALQTLQCVGEHVERTQLRQPETDGVLSPLEIFQMSPEVTLRVLQTRAGNCTQRQLQAAFVTLQTLSLITSLSRSHWRLVNVTKEQKPSQPSLPNAT
jgi:hypothetical protein